MSSDPRQWGVSSLQLQRPEHIFFDGEVRPWDEGVLHVSTEAVVRGLNVFEGLKGHWLESGDFGWRTLRRHYERMTRSARLDIVADLAEELGIELERRPVDRSELYIADELGFTGTLSEITLVRSIDDLTLPEEAPILSAVEQRYRDAVLGVGPHPSVELSIPPL